MNTETIIILGVLAVAAYYLYQQSQAQQAKDNQTNGLASLESGIGNLLSNYA